MRFLTMAMVCMAMATANAAHAMIPQTMSYQGVLADGGGAIVPDGTYDFTFRMYNVISGGTALWTETHTGVQVTSGRFSVVLGNSASGAVPLNLNFDTQYWLGISVDGGSELSPRIELAAAGYSLNAAGVVDGAITSTKIAANAVTASHIASGAVGAAEIATNAVGASEIAANAVGASEIATNAVGTSEIAADAVTASEIATSAVGALEIATGAVGSSEVLNNSLFDVDILDEPGVAHERGTTILSLTGLDVEVASREITIPTSGYVVALGSVEGRVRPDGAGFAWFRVSMSTSLSHDFSNYRYYEIDNADDAGLIHTAPLSVQETFWFSTSGTKTIYLVADGSTNGLPEIRFGSLTLMFFPTAYGTITLDPASAQEVIEDPARASVSPLIQR